MSRTKKHIERYFLKKDEWKRSSFERLNPPSKEFKKYLKKSHKAKAKQAIKNGEYVVIPYFKKCHKYKCIMEW